MGIGRMAARSFARGVAQQRSQQQAQQNAATSGAHKTWPGEWARAQQSARAACQRNPRYDFGDR